MDRSLPMLWLWVRLDLRELQQHSTCSGGGTTMGAALRYIREWPLTTAEDLTTGEEQEDSSEGTGEVQRAGRKVATGCVKFVEGKECGTLHVDSQGRGQEWSRALAQP